MTNSRRVTIGIKAPVGMDWKDMTVAQLKALRLFVTCAEQILDQIVDNTEPQSQMICLMNGQGSRPFMYLSNTGNEEVLSLIAKQMEPDKVDVKVVRPKQEEE